MGQIAQAAKNPNTFSPQPSGFSGAEWATRIGGMGAKGLGQGLNNYYQQNAMQRQARPDQPQAPAPQQQQINWPDFGPNRNSSLLPRGNNLAFYGDSGVA